MAEKLKSISKRIHWYLLLKAAAFALAWLWFPWWLFAVVALVIYFTPFFQPERFAFPFFVLLILSYVQAPGWFFAVIFGLMFYFLLLIKELLLVERRSAYELLVFLLSFLLLRDFYLRFNQGVAGTAPLFALLVAALVALLLRNYIRAFEGGEERHPGLRRVSVGFSFLLFWQILMIGLFLPVDFIYQTAIVFLPIVLVVDLLPERLAGSLDRTKILTSATVIFALLVIVITSARWTL